MKSKFLFITGLVALSLASCATASTKSVNVPGHPYRTDPDCKRTQPLGKFDEKCDEPKLGFKGFSAPPNMTPAIGGGALSL